MSSPLWNTIRSFWTPETCRDPQWLREARRDKAIFVIIVASNVIPVAAVVIAAVNIAR